jgi:predicted nucleotide-binding protein (sugar kinase/HSP70/actin superfamily)
MGDKPYLILELDEHSAVAGAITRLEAFRNVIRNDRNRRLSRMEPPGRNRHREPLSRFLSSRGQAEESFGETG